MSKGCICIGNYMYIVSKVLAYNHVKMSPLKSPGTQGPFSVAPAMGALKKSAKHPPSLVTPLKVGGGGGGDFFLERKKHIA